ncbi:MAG TPA: HRDC domain-containing protein [Mycobacteriales bacterium]|nr:HRDC domain-containing protein [Mycobacteriales bacterium]
MTDTSAACAPAVPLVEPSDGVPPVVVTPVALAAAASALAAGSGPVAVDAERASGYRYGQRAYLVQLRRAGAGTVLIDPVACPDLAIVRDALVDTEWVLHAAGQDLPCLAEVGLRPRTLFDTELAARLLGHPRVGLATMVETVLGLALEKGHAAVDWSTRPLPEPWLRYAALDVEVLVDLRDALEERLREAGKLGWAREEFAAIATALPREPPAEPWRRTSGVHRLRTRRQLATVRALWEARDALARDRDVAPGRLLPDSAIIAAALAPAPATPAALGSLPGFVGRAARAQQRRWYAALRAAAALEESALPALAARGADLPPPANRWADRDPAAAARLAATRAVVAAIADEHTLPTENLLQPDAVRRLAWSPPDELSPERVGDLLRGCGARAWQVALTATALAKALRRLEVRGVGG